MRIRALGVVLGLLVAGSCAGASSDDRGQKESARCRTDAATATDLEYVPRTLSSRGSTTLDLYTPARAEGDCSVPVVVWVHGGGWQVGDKGRNVSAKVALFAQAGYVFASVNYRLTDPAAPDPVVYPTHNQDVAAAIAWLTNHVDEYGGDPRRMAVLGHSAGAAIVAAIATDESYLQSHGLDLDALTCVAPLDTQGFEITGRSEVYRLAFPDPQTWADASPINHVEVGKDIPPMLLVERGVPARRATLKTFVDALETADVPVTVVDASALTHGDVSDNIGKPGDTVMTEPVMKFLDDCFAG